LRNCDTKIDLSAIATRQFWRTPEGIQIALQGFIYPAILLVSMALVDQTQRILLGRACFIVDVVCSLSGRSKTIKDSHATISPRKNGNSCIENRSRSIQVRG
jgi:hypothetical protein